MVQGTLRKLTASLLCTVAMVFLWLTSAAAQTTQPDGLSSSEDPLLGTTSNLAAHPDRDDVAKQIFETENALNAIQRTLDPKEQKTAAQIRSFINGASEALKYDDLDGASTMSMKARALLLELCKDRHSGQKAKLRPI